MNMDSKTTIEDIKKLIKDHCTARDWDQFHNAKDLSIGIITEASELLEHFRWKNPKEVEEIMHNPKTRLEVSEEMADVLYFLGRLAERYNIDLSEEFFRKMEKNEKKYPVEKAKGSNKKYNEL